MAGLAPLTGSESSKEAGSSTVTSREGAGGGAGVVVRVMRVDTGWESVHGLVSAQERWSSPCPPEAPRGRYVKIRRGQRLMVSGQDGGGALARTWPQASGSASSVRAREALGGGRGDPMLAVPWRVLGIPRAAT